MAGEFREAGEVRCDPAMARVYEHGWQSWSPTGVYPALATSPRPRRPLWQTTGHRPERPAPPSGFQGEGLLAVEVDGHARVWSAPDPHREVPSIRARPEAGRIVVEADGDLDEHESASGLDDALRAWADAVAERLDVRLEPASGPMWFSWYCYWQHVTAADIEANLDAIDRHELPVGIIQIDDGHQAGIGDWLDQSPGFPDLPGLAARIRGSGRLPGIWTAPLLVGEDSRLAAEQPGWLAGDASGGRNWDQELAILDV